MRKLDGRIRASLSGLMSHTAFKDISEVHVACCVLLLLMQHPPPLPPLSQLSSSLVPPRMVHFLGDQNWRFRLSCFYSHLVTLTLLSISWSHISHHSLLYLSTSFPLPPGLPDLAEVTLPYLTGLNSVALVTTRHVSDFIAALFTGLMAFLIFSDNSDIITPLENQPVTIFRVWNNVYIHYVPAGVLRLVGGGEVEGNFR